MPPHTSSLGKVLFAWAALPLPTGPLVALTERSRASLAELEEDLAGCRRRGYATTVDELEVGLTGVAAPVRGHGGEVIAALGISGPTPRLESRLAQVGRLLKLQAGQLSELLARRTPKEGVA